MLLLHSDSMLSLARLFSKETVVSRLIHETSTPSVLNYRLINAYYLLRENLDKLMHKTKFRQINVSSERAPQGRVH